MKKSLRRSKLRLVLGSAYYCLRRYLVWRSGQYKFAGQHEGENLEKIWFCHATPLLRQLKDVEMYLQYNKITNLKIAVQKVNQVILYPGETFSYWRLIGRPSRKKGYLPGMVLKNGSFEPGTGGGLCQLSNLIYWMTLHTPLTVVERHRHSYDVFPDVNRRQPFGSGATCHYNYLDLMIRNDTAQPFQLFVRVTADHLEGCWAGAVENKYKYEVYEGEHRIEQELWGGYSRHNVLRRRILDAEGGLVEDQYITENHSLMMYNPLLE
ncbi:MAG: VanW family protein [Clostridiales bacterium]